MDAAPPGPAVQSEGGKAFRLVSPFEPKGDQPKAIAELVGGIKERDRDQVLLGVTGSGKTFTMAKIIEQTQRPALIMAPNKTLAAQLYSEFQARSFRRMRSNILSPITIIISPKPMSRAPTPSSKRIVQRERADRPDAPRRDARHS